MRLHPPSKSFSSVTFFMRLIAAKDAKDAKKAQLKPAIAPGYFVSFAYFVVKTFQCPNALKKLTRIVVNHSVVL
jgi:hypothetical protein